MNSVPNPSAITAKLAVMTNQQLAQFAQMHKNDPYMLPLASAEDARRKAIRQGAMVGKAGQQPTVADQAVNAIAQEAQPAMPQVAAAQLPENTGIAPLNAPNIQGMADGGIAGYAGGTPKGTFDVDAYLNNPNVQRYLKYINMYEGSPQPHHMVNYKEAQSLEDHPRIPVRFGKAKNQVSTAAGAYQLLGKTWDEQKNKLGLTDFSLVNQQRAAIGVLKDQGVLNDVVKGDFQKANTKAKNIWASIPGSTIGKETGQVPKVNKEAERLINAKAPEKGFGLSPAMAKLFTNLAPGEEARAGELMSRAPVSNGTTGITQLPNIAEANRSNTISGKVNGPAAVRAPEEPFVSQADQIPGSIQQPPRAPEENKLLRAGKDILGAPEALVSALTAGAAPVTHLLPMGVAALSGQPISREEAFNAVTYAPRLDVSKGSLENLEKAAVQDFKLPPVIPGVAGPRGRRVSPVMEAEAAAARAAADAAAGKVENLRLPPPPKPARPAGPSLAAERPDSPAFPLKDATLEMQREAQALRDKQALQNLAKDKNEANIAERKAVAAGENAKSGNLLDEAMKARALEQAKRDSYTRALATTSRSANAASQATVPPAEVKRPYEAFEEGFTAPETNYQLPKPETFPAPTAEQAAAPTAAEAKKGFNLSDEDWLNLGLGLLSGGPREGNALQDLMAKTGKAGISALAARKEREKAKEESDFKKLMGKYYQDIGAAQSRPGETERMINQIAKDNNMSFTDALREYKSMSYGAGSLSPALLLKEYNKNSKDLMMGDMFRSQYPTFESYLAAHQAGASGGADPAQIDPNLAAQYKIVGSRPIQ
jgi:muramidase (phage lysozyme)